MTHRHWITLVVVALAVPVMADAQGFGGSAGSMGRPGRGLRGSPSFMMELYPPELIMRNQTELGLSDSQKQAILNASRDTRNAIDPIQWELQSEQEKLTALVSADVVDETALLAQAEIVMDLEKRLKKQHLLLLVKIKNQLTPEQQQQAKSLRGSMRRGGAFRDGPGGRGRGGPQGRLPDQ